jgi:AcrR family transcriptional regulator
VSAGGSLAGGHGLRADDGRLVRGRRSRARIRQAARALFRERGFDATTLRAIAERAGMGASSIYRHIRSKEELLVEELADLQETAWRTQRLRKDRSLGARERVAGLLDTQHALLARTPDLTTIALRAITHPEARVARRALALQDRSVGLLVEILQEGRLRGEVAPGVDVVAAAQTLFHAASGARLAWANGLLTANACRAALTRAVDLLFRGIESREPR